MDPQAPFVPETPKVDDPERVVNEVESRVERDNHWITILAMALFVLGSLAVVVFLYYQNQQLKEMLASYQTPAKTPSPSATVDPTASWKTYTDKSGRFSFKYPSNLAEFEGGVSGPTNGVPKVLANFADNTTVSEGTDAPFDGFSIYTASLEGKSFDEYIKKEKIDREKRDIEIWEATGQTTQSTLQQWITLNGPAFPEITVYYLQLPDGKNVVTFGRTKKSGGFPKVFDQVLSTFKFLEASPIPSSSPVPSSPLP